ncbi:unnamed protein product [Didymodactylos carnosus]|uniref:PI3K/PI4K catalytic domain-containing protein n=1 Tax=Didymodactylos carnosus TaxID=1234261 RepID=A0A815DC41_9BILA|nr:unnamed protein product [Didymodactylos carnosus]CAF1299592.1 unnamed protein product [Didymodactylos carnosus]CAF4096186.1 unnamed protein product [Didymodactylos carnosus]CAF4121080.1 unnamed protein product [Didymodactylos carnosus]
MASTENLSNAVSGNYDNEFLCSLQSLLGISDVGHVTPPKTLHLPSIVDESFLNSLPNVVIHNLLNNESINYLMMNHTSIILSIFDVLLIIMLCLTNASEYAEHYSPNFDLIFKYGDDLRQDMLALQFIHMIDMIWKANGLNLNALCRWIVKHNQEEARLKSAIEPFTQS